LFARAQNSIANGQAPQELLPPSPTTPLNVNLVRKDEDYVAPPEPKYTAFFGCGNKLGGEASAAAAAAAPATMIPASEWVRFAPRLVLGSLFLSFTCLRWPGCE
jgi:hypothetical protein